MTDWLPVGKHRMRVEDDLMLFDAVGDVTRSDMEAMISEFDLIHQAYGYGLFYVQVIQVGLIQQEARRATVEYNRAKRPRWSMAVSGITGPVGLITRGTLTLAVSAIRLVTGQAIPVAFFSDDKSARSWLSEQQSRWRAKSRAPQA